ncbi:putative EGF-like domain-containing protein [Plasmopara halstedii]
MKSVAFLSLVTLTASVVADTKSTTFPGRCETTKDCLTYGSNYACISVDTSVAGLERLSMCIPGAQVCSGRIAGLCPTFTTWPSKYRVIQPICAFVEVDNCDEMYNVTISSHAGSNGTVDDDTDVSISSANGTGTVQCYQRNFTVNNDYVVVNGIYQCLDKAKFVNQNGGHIKNITDTVVEQCGWNVTTHTLCSGQGTCSPLVDFAQDYECKCNAGYNSSDHCFAVVSNECSSVAQCGTKGMCSFEKGTTTGECACEVGAKGNQCLQCDASASSEVVCNGHGTCGTNGRCSCSQGYNGTFCGDSTGSKTSSTSPSEATSVGMATITVIAAGLFMATII